MRTERQQDPGAPPVERLRRHEIMRGLLPLCALAALAICPAQIQAQAPLSAIDWLQETQRPFSGTDPEPGPGSGQGSSGGGSAGYPITPQTGDIWVSDLISMHSIDAPSPEAVGLFPAARVGLPADLWAQSPVTDLTVLIRTLPGDTLPALRGLALSLLMAEFAPPAHDPGMTDDAARQSAALAYVLARIEKLIAFGALDQAAALLDTLGSEDMALRKRAFDIALLLGEEGTACRDVLEGAPPFSGAAERVFCLARAGRWAEAERLHASLLQAGALQPPYAELLEDFLDAEDLLHTDPPPDWLGEDYVQPHNLSPLAWRLLEAIGAPVAAHGLSVAFAHADLRGTIGWRAQLEAAERLVRAGALPPNRLLGLYTERNAAASGGIWERVRAIQRLEAALGRGHGGDIAVALDRVWPLIADAELEVAFAALYADALLEAPLEGEAALQAATIGLLATDPQRAAHRLAEGNARQRFLAALALGQPAEPPEGARAALQASIADSLGEELPTVPQALSQLLQQGRPGEALLIALARLNGAIDPDALGNVLALLRHLGLEEVARATALQALLLERRG